MDFLKTGKLQNEFLQNLLGKIDIRDDRVVIGPGIGEDAAAIDMGERYLIVKSDPITFVADKIGWYVVNVNANDIAAMGGIPKWFLVTALLPERGTTTADVEEIMHDLRESCEELGISLIGGHTEITHGLSNPILSGTMLGEVDKERLINNNRIAEGDLLYITKGVAIEATSIIARERRDEVIAEFGEAFFKRCLNFLRKPGISVLSEARRVLEASVPVHITGMHDPTEGGVLAGAYEMAAGAGIGVTIEGDRIPVFDETRRLCEHFGLSPISLIASGALLIAVSREDGERLESLFDRSSDNTISCIGEFSGEKNYLLEDGKRKILQPSERDEITKLFDRP
jgi:hydrogenase maturation factor